MRCMMTMMPVSPPHKPYLNDDLTECAMIWHHSFNVIVKHPDNKLPLTLHTGTRKGDYKLLWKWHGEVSLYAPAKSKLR